MAAQAAAGGEPAVPRGKHHVVCACANNCASVNERCWCLKWMELARCASGRSSVDERDPTASDLTVSGLTNVSQANVKANMTSDFTIQLFSM